MVPSWVSPGDEQEKGKEGKTANCHKQLCAGSVRTKKKESEREREGAFYDTAVDAVGLGRAVWCQ